MKVKLWSACIESLYIYNQCQNFQYKIMAWILGYMRWLQIVVCTQLRGIQYLEIRFQNKFCHLQLSYNRISNLYLIITSFTTARIMAYATAISILYMVIYTYTFVAEFFVIKKCNNPNVLILSKIKHDYSTSTPFYSKIPALISDRLCIINILTSYCYFGILIFFKVSARILLFNFLGYS